MAHALRPLLFAFLTLSSTATAQQAVTVNTDRGPVTGRQTAALRTFFGIPFAAPPTGNSRWKAPQPAAAWTAPRDAGKFGNVCVQVTGVFDVPGEVGGQVKGDEDCLYLNVYAPVGTAPNRRLPVMVWLHGGSFTLGAGSDYDAGVLAQKQGVVVVTLNYRLGALGFLALPSLNAEAGGASGNYGLQDQQAALRWVQGNIAAFGGDAGNVTLFGESAGGFSVCAQLASPRAANLFQKAIIQSGLCASPGNSVSAASAARRNVAYALRVGCRSTDLACLRKLDPKTIVSTPVPGVRPLSNLVWSPVYDTPLLPLSLGTAFARGAFNRVPVMSGSNRDEGRLFISLAATGGKPILPYQYWGGTGLLVGARNNSRVLAQYPLRNYATPALAFATVFTDAVFSCPTLSVAGALSQYVPVYDFEFADPQAVTSIKPAADLPGLGSSHSSGLVYVFQTPLAGLADPAQFTSGQRTLSGAFSRAWATFAKTGDPNTAGQPQWRAFDPARGNVQIFTPTGIAESIRFADDHKCAFWSGLALN